MGNFWLPICGKCKKIFDVTKQRIFKLCCPKTLQERLKVQKRSFAYFAY